MDQETQQILSLCSVSTRMAAQTFFPDRFNQPFAENVHGEIFKRIDGPSNKVGIAAPRGWGKTSIVALALMARYILFRLCSFIVYINKSETAAIMQTENLKRELVTNRMIKSFFGKVRTRSAGDDEIEEQFSKKAWVAYDTFILPRGAGQQVRGVLFKNDRPGLIIIDDLEDKKKVMNEELRTELKTWLYADVLEAIPQLHMNWKIVYIDTLKHEDALLQHVLTSKDWDSVRLEACDDNLESTAPNFISTETIHRQWQAAVDAGETDTFFQEKRNLPISSKDASFQRSYFHYYNVPNDIGFKEGDVKKTEPEIQMDRNIETVILLDPAKTVKVHSAESAILGIGIDLTSARLYIRDAISEKMYPDEIYDALFGMGLRLKAKVMGIEETSLNEFIRQPIKNEMFRRGSFFELVWLKARGGMKKELRVKELVPYYRGGYIYHNASCATTKKLEQQLLMFPRSALWDLMDCLAYIIEMLELGERYFSPSENPNDIEAEYKELDYDEPVDNWRVMQ
jgi:predicted phage terminase large subunit-like protein